MPQKDHHAFSFCTDLISSHFELFAFCMAVMWLACQGLMTAKDISIPDIHKAGSLHSQCFLTFCLESRRNSVLGFHIPEFLSKEEKSKIYVLFLRSCPVSMLYSFSNFGSNSSCRMLLLLLVVVMGKCRIPPLLKKHNLQNTIAGNIVGIGLWYGDSFCIDFCIIKPNNGKSKKANGFQLVYVLEYHTLHRISKRIMQSYNLSKLQDQTLR